VLRQSDQDKLWDYFQNEGVSSFDASRARMEFLVERLASDSVVLNIGVGNGVLEALAIAKGVDMWALDPGERAIARLREQLGLASKAQVGYSQAIPFGAAAFDVVIMSEVLEHLKPEVFAATLAEVKRVLKDDGRLIGTVPARENLTDSETVCPHCGHHFHRWGHEQSFDESQLRAKLSTVFGSVRVTEHFFAEWRGVSWWRRTQGLIKQFLSWRGIGTYGINRNFYFEAHKARL
jgi:SAM-dependent methyltransferase